MPAAGPQLPQGTHSLARGLPAAEFGLTPFCSPILVGTSLELEEAVDMGGFLFLTSSLLGICFFKTARESQSCANKTTKLGAINLII